MVHRNGVGLRSALTGLALATLLACGAAEAASGAGDRTISIHGSKVHFRVSAGCGPTIVLESGGGLDASQWTQLQPQLHEATGAAVVSYDRPGFGASDLPPQALTLEQQVEWLHGALSQLHVPTRVILVGHSYGAFLTQVYANRYQKSVDAVVLIDPNTVAFIDSIGGPQNVPISISDDMPAKVKLATERMRDSAPETVRIARSAPLPASIPVTVIAAGKRWLPSDEWNDKFAAARKSLVEGFPNRKLIVATGSGHMVTAERPHVVLEAVEDAIRQARKADHSGERCRKDKQP